MEFEFVVERSRAYSDSEGFGAKKGREGPVRGVVCHQHQRVSAPALRCSARECGKDRGQETRLCLVDGGH